MITDDDEDELRDRQTQDAVQQTDHFHKQKRIWNQ